MEDKFGEAKLIIGAAHVICGRFNQLVYIIEQLCVCPAFWKQSMPLAASVEPGKAREKIGEVNLHQMKVLSQVQPNEASPINVLPKVSPKALLQKKILY